MNTTETPSLCGLKREDFQTTINGKNTDLFILRNSLGYEVAVTNYGGAIVAIMVPDKDGNMVTITYRKLLILQNLIFLLLSAVLATASRKVSFS